MAAPPLGGEQGLPGGGHGVVPKGPGGRRGGGVHRRVHRRGHRPAGDHRGPRSARTAAPWWPSTSCRKSSCSTSAPSSCPRATSFFPLRQHRPRHRTGRTRLEAEEAAIQAYLDDSHRAHQPGGSWTAYRSNVTDLSGQRRAVYYNPHGQRLVLHRHHGPTAPFWGPFTCSPGVFGLLILASLGGLAAMAWRGPAAGRPGAQDQRDRAGAGQLLLRPVPGGLRGRDLRDDQGAPTTCGAASPPGGLRPACFRPPARSSRPTPTGTLSQSFSCEKIRVPGKGPGAGVRRGISSGCSGRSTAG